jgi:hypothetical protein
MFFANPWGNAPKCQTLSLPFFERLEQVKQLRPGLISPSLEVSEHYGVSQEENRKLFNMREAQEQQLRTTSHDLVSTRD